jgi:hypothetical protein
MPAILKRRPAPPILAVSAVILLVLVFVLLSGGGSQGAATSGLAEYMPPETLAYAETDLRPDDRVRAEVDEVSRRLTGMSLSASLGKALVRGGKAGIDYPVEVEPWISGPVAIATGKTRKQFGLVVEVEDLVAASAFSDGLPERSGFPEEARSGIVGGALVVAGSESWFSKIATSWQGESLADVPAFEEMAGSLPAGGLANFYLSNDSLLDLADGAGFNAAGLFSTVGLELEGTGTAMTLTVEGDLISLDGRSGLRSGEASPDARELIESLPADSVLAVGVGDIGKSAGELIPALVGGKAGDSADSGEGGAADPGEKAGGAGTGATGGVGDLGEALDQASAFGVDLPALIESLETAGIFVTVGSPQQIRGALVATTSDPDLVKDTIQSVSALGAFAGGDLIKPLPPGLEGFSVALPAMQGTRVAVASEGDRLVIALGAGAARQALASGGASLGDTALFRKAASSLSGENLNLFARPSVLAPLLREKVGDYFGAGGHSGHGGQAKADQSFERKRGSSALRGREPTAEKLTRLVSGIASIVAGSGDDGSFELDLGLKK